MGGINSNNSVNNRRKTPAIYAGDVNNVSSAPEGLVVFDDSAGFRILRWNGATYDVYSSGGAPVDAWVQNGNSFGINSEIGLNDDFDLDIIRNNNTRIRLSGDNIIFIDDAGNDMGIFNMNGEWTFRSDDSAFDSLFIGSGGFVGFRSQDGVGGSLDRLSIEEGSEVVNMVVRNSTFVLKDTDANGGGDLVVMDGAGGEFYVNSGAAGVLDNRFFVGDGIGDIDSGFNNSNFSVRRDQTSNFNVDPEGNIFQNPIREALLYADIDGNIIDGNAMVPNIYTQDGTLTGSRILDGDGFDLTFRGMENFIVDVFGGSNIDLYCLNQFFIRADNEIHIQTETGSGSNIHIDSDLDLVMTSQAVMSLSAVGGINVEDGTNLSLGGETAGSILEYRNASAAPSTVIYTLPINAYGNPANILGDPAQWIRVDIAGGAYYIPCYAN